jgi:hypothetical protein
VPLAVRMHVKGTVQLVNRRATEPAVKDGKRFAHAFPPAGFSTRLQHPAEENKGEKSS